MGFNILNLPRDFKFLQKRIFATFDGKTPIQPKVKFQPPPKSTPQQKQQDNQVILTALQRLLRDSKTKTLDKEFNVGRHIR